MEKVFTTFDQVQANFIINIYKEEKILFSVTGLADVGLMTSQKIEIFVSKEHLIKAKQIIDEVVIKKK